MVKFDVAGLIGGIIHKGREPGGVTIDPQVVSNVSNNKNMFHNHQNLINNVHIIIPGLSTCFVLMDLLYIE